MNKFDNSNVRKIWNRAHTDNTSSTEPDDEIVRFGQHLQAIDFTGGKLLDVACGQGRHALYLGDLGFKVSGFDHSEAAVHAAKERARQRNIQVSLHVAKLQSLPYPPDYFHSAACARVLPYHYRVDIIEGLREIRRVLTTGGWLYLDLLTLEDAYYGVGKKLEENTFLDQDGVPVHFSPEEEVSFLLHGFSLERLSRLETGTPSNLRVTWEVWARKL